MASPEIRIMCIANIFYREMHFKKAGDCEQGHKHKFAHITDLRKGSLEVEVNGEKTVFHAPDYIYIDPDFAHKLTALEDDTWASCIHAVRGSDNVGDILAPDAVPNGIVLKQRLASQVIKEGEV